MTARDLHKHYRDARGRRTALAGVSLDVADGETLVVLGPSGAGKSTLLRIIAGLEIPDAGSLALDGRNQLVLPAQKRRVALVFQDDALFPHLTIAENLAFPLRLRRESRNVVAARVRAVAEALDIVPHLGERPARLSGGERQRAAIARAVLSDPRVLLLDEPLAHLDPQLRSHVQRQFVRFRRTFRGGAIYVTHDHVEALRAGDRLAIMIDGAIVQSADAQHVYDFPADVRVARFFGSPPMNLLQGDDCILGIRPERVRIDADAALRGRVTARESTGADVLLYVTTPLGEAIVRASASQTLPAVGEETGLSLPPGSVRRFDRRSGVLRS